jgi:ribosomal-protein-alanine N-acetyltransferase
MSSLPNIRPAARGLPAHVHVRRAITSDLPKLVALENRIFSSDCLSARQWKQHLESNTAIVYVASIEREVIGAGVLFFRRGNDIARIYSLAVAEESRGIGVGEALLEACEEAAQARHCKRMRVEVRRDNHGAQRLYLRRGFTQIGERSAYFEDGTDAFRYEKQFCVAER